MTAAPLTTQMSTAQIADLIRHLAQTGDPAFVELAESVGTTDSLVAYLQALPRRDDDGILGRMSPMPPDPNGVERAAMFVGAAELLGPERLRTQPRTQPQKRRATP